MSMRKKFVLFVTITILLISSFFCGCDLNLNSETNPDGNAVSYELINRITLEKMSANLAVYTLDSSAGKEYTGSGVIIKCEKEEFGIIIKEIQYTFYFLTNNHVVCGGKSGLKYEVCDYLERTFNAEFIKSSASYDLALLKFTVTESDLTLTRDGTDDVIAPSVIGFAKNSDLNKGDIVFAVGQPHKQRNAVTIGRYLKKNTVGHSDSVYSLVDFEVLLTDAYTMNGSSGGMMLDSDLNLVGVIFGGIYSAETKNFQNSCAIPIEQVNEFIDYCGLTLETDGDGGESQESTSKVKGKVA